MNTAQMTPIADLASAEIEDASDIIELAEEADQFLRAQKWCRGIRAGWYADGWPGILGVFLFDIDPAPGADDRVWVLVGDIPPAYIDIVSCPTVAEALEGYCYAMEEWVSRVRAGERLDDAIPVLRRVSLRPVEATTEMVDAVARRLEFIRENLLTELSGD